MDAILFQQLNKFFPVPGNVVYLIDCNNFTNQTFSAPEKDK